MTRGTPIQMVDRGARHWLIGGATSMAHIVITLEASIAIEVALAHILFQ